MAEETALITVEKLNIPALFVDGGMDKILEQIEVKAFDFTPNLETLSGRREIASMANKVARSKVLIDDLGKNLVSDWKEKAKKVDAVRKQARDFLDDLKARVRLPLSEWEKAEQARIDGYKARINEMISLGNPNDGFGNSLTSVALKARLSLIEMVVVDEKTFGEAVDEAARVKEEYSAILTSSIERQEKYEKEQAELEALRKEKAERDRLDYEEKIRREAAEKATRDAEAKALRDKEASERREREAKEALQRAELEKIAAAKRAEDARIAAEERARIAQERAVKEAEDRARAEADRKERDRIEAERRAKEAAEKKAADLKHRSRIENEALASFEAAGVDSTISRSVIDAVKAGKIKHISINY